MLASLTPCVAAENVAVVHCRTGKRRTCTVIACLMAWLGAASDPLQAMQVVAQRRGIPISSLTIPSQRRCVRIQESPPLTPRSVGGPAVRDVNVATLQPRLLSNRVFV